MPLFDLDHEYGYVLDPEQREALVPAISRYERDRFLDAYYSLFGPLDHFVRRLAPRLRRCNAGRTRPKDKRCPAPKLSFHLHRRGPSHIGAHDGSTSGIKEVYDCPVPAHFLDAQAIPELRNPGTNELCNAVAQHDAEPAERDARPEALRRDASPEKGTRIRVTALS
jgi:hypothetical protein